MNFAEMLAPEVWLSASGGPRYIQLKQRIERAIESKELPPGTPLPPERELQYELPRMKRLWTHLDRQKGGGVSGRGGPD